MDVPPQVTMEVPAVAPPVVPDIIAEIRQVIPEPEALSPAAALARVVWEPAVRWESVAQVSLLMAAAVAAVIMVAAARATAAAAPEAALQLRQLHQLYILRVTSQVTDKLLSLRP